MPANLTPEYKRAEALLREAKTNEEKITALELMLSTIPKHKGTDHMQADIKRRLARLRDAPTTKAGARQADVFHVPRGAAAGQVVLLGAPNAGKSALVARLTNAHVTVADFPFSTHAPVPGILNYEDIQIQLVDMPPVTRDHVEAGQVGAYRNGDLVLLVVDLASPDVTDQMETCLDFLQQRSLLVPPDVGPEDELYRRMARPCLGVGAKMDLAQPDDLAVLKEMYENRLPLVGASVNDHESLARLARRIFETLDIVRIYSKIPGKAPDMDQPFVLPRRGTVSDLAHKVHRDLAANLSYARIWGKDKFPGQKVPRDYILQDKDVIELHFA